MYFSILRQPLGAEGHVMCTGETIYGDCESYMGLNGFRVPDDFASYIAHDVVVLGATLLPYTRNRT